MSSKSPRSWLRFSLKSLFLLVLLVATYFAGWRSALWTAEREKEEAIRKAVEELEEVRDFEVLDRLIRATIKPSTGELLTDLVEDARQNEAMELEKSDASSPPPKDSEAPPTTSLHVQP